MYGAVRLDTPEQIRAAWDERARGFFVEREFESGLADMTVGTPVVAYINEGRWVADCPECNGGIAVWPGMPDACCYDSGHVWTVTFPAVAEIGQAEALLEHRAEPRTRNWIPAAETIDDLKAENVLRGVPIV